MITIMNRKMRKIKIHESKKLNQLRKMLNKQHLKMKFLTIKIMIKLFAKIMLSNTMIIFLK